MVGAQSNLAGGKTFLPEIMYEKLEKMPEFYIMLARKKYFPGFFWGEGGVVGEGNPLAPVSYAYGWAPSPPPAKSGPANGDRGATAAVAKLAKHIWLQHFRFLISIAWAYAGTACLRTEKRRTSNFVVLYAYSQGRLEQMEGRP